MDAAPLLGYIFRLHRDETDCLSAKQRNVFVDAPECVRSALSCYLDVRDLVEFQKRNRGRYGRHMVVCALLGPGHGFIKLVNPSKNTHSSVWLKRKHLWRYACLFSAT